MVSLILVCEALGNGLKGGLLNIVDFTFNKLPQVTHHRIVAEQIFIAHGYLQSEKQRETLINSFWSQLVHRLEFDDHHLDQVAQFVISYH